MNNSFFNSVELINLLAKWKKQLFLVAGASLVLSVIFSSPFFIKPKFKSVAVLYPSNLMAYSTESATEQMLQLTPISLNYLYHIQYRNQSVSAFAYNKQ